jgi:hypothetical protein
MTALALMRRTGGEIQQNTALHYTTLHYTTTRGFACWGGVRDAVGFRHSIA